jgi:ketosteroid isomerase-like protein
VTCHDRSGVTAAVLAGSSEGQLLLYKRLKRGRRQQNHSSGAASGACSAHGKQAGGGGAVRPFYRQRHGRRHGLDDRRRDLAHTGKPELLPTAGTYQKEALRKLFDRMLAQLESGLKMDVVATISEGDRVAAEVTSSGDLRNGRKYRQEYHFVIAFRAGKIASVREYLDTQHVHDVWLRG